MSFTLFLNQLADISHKHYSSLMEKAKEQDRLAAIRKNQRAAERFAREAQAKAEEYDRQLQHIKNNCLAKNDNELMSRFEELSMLDEPGGTIATIHKHYNYYISEWIYSLSSDGQLTRHRDQDGAVVTFDGIGELMDDFARYRHCGFDIYVPAQTSSSSFS
jgi:hypothetical protein